MTRYEKKNYADNFGDMKHHRFQRKIRGHKFAGVGNKFERRHGWGYVKRRALLAD